MKGVEKGDKVRLSYKIKLEDGSVFESSETNGPLDFIAGEGSVLQALDNGVIGMMPGDSKVIKIPADQAYGAKKDERIFRMPKTKAPALYEVGKTVTVYRADDKPIKVKVIGETEDAFVIDGNHPLAGHDLIFEVKLI